MHTGTCQHVEHYAGSSATALQNQSIPACERCARPGFVSIRQVHARNGHRPPKLHRQLVSDGPRHIKAASQTVLKDSRGAASIFGRDLEGLRMLLDGDNLSWSQFTIHFGMR